MNATTNPPSVNRLNDTKRKQARDMGYGYEYDYEADGIQWDLIAEALNVTTDRKAPAFRKMRSAYYYGRNEHNR